MGSQAYRIRLMVLIRNMTVTQSAVSAEGSIEISATDPNAQIARIELKKEGSIIFSILKEDNSYDEVIRISEEGFFVEGRKVPCDDLDSHDVMVYRVMTSFLRGSGCLINGI